MSTGDDGDDRDWESVAEELGGRLTEIEAELGTVETAAEISDLETRLDEAETDLADSAIPEDAEDRENLESAIAELREALPPTWLPTIRDLEDRLDSVEADIEEIDPGTDVDAIESALDDIAADLENSEVPSDADEYATVEDRIADARSELPADQDLVAWDFEADLADIETDLEDAETEAELDEIDERLDDIEAAIGSSSLPDGDEDGEDGDDDGDEEMAQDDLLEDVERLREAVEEKRGPYAEDVTAEVESAEGTLNEGDWTDSGEETLVDAVGTFLDSAGEKLDADFGTAGENPSDLALSLASVHEAVEDADLDPDDDADVIEGLLAASGDLQATLDDAEEWGDLTVQEQLDRTGFYDVLNPENRKDYPPEWNAVKIYEKQYAGGDSEAIEPILLALEKFESDFMEENVLDTLERIAPPEAYEELHALAQKRNQQPIRILGRIGDERAAETLHEFLEGGDVSLRKVSLRALGAIGSADSVQPVANQLAADNAEVRSTAARALGLVGDTRVIDPLADVLDEDPADEVRASAAWALNQIGTERAREAAAAYADDAAYIVQVEAQKAQAATESAA